MFFDIILLRMKALTAIIFILITFATLAEDLPFFQTAIENTKSNCIGISGELEKIKTMTGLNTAVTGVGTLVGGGALYAGIKKSEKDKLAERIQKQLKNIDSISDEEFLVLLGNMANYKQRSELENGLKETTEKSKKLGNWRTGLIAGNATTNIVGTIIAHQNKNSSEDIIVQVTACLESLRYLKNTIIQARLDGENENTILYVQKIINECGKYNIKDAEKIPKRSEIVKWSAVVGIGTGISGTITSSIANKDSIINNDSDEGKQKEKKLNTASNVLAGASTLASGVATGFNAATILAINKTINISINCEAALK